VYAVDGSWLNLPHAQALVDAFGRPSAASGKTPMPQLLLVTMDLVNLGWFTDLRLGRCNHSELALAREMTDSLGKGDLVLGDRLFFQTSWIAALVRRGVEALLRAAKNRITSLTAESIVAVQRQRRGGGVIDCEVELKVATDHHGKPTALLPLRYIEITINGETYCFLTTLSKDRISAPAVAELYLARWEIETDYRLFKGPNHLPVIISRTPMTVRQEILLRILTHNSVRFVQADACLLPLSRGELLVSRARATFCRVPAAHAAAVRQALRAPTPVPPDLHADLERHGFFAPPRPAKPDPPSVQLQLTNACNLACQYCCTNSGRARGCEVSQARLRQVVREIPEALGPDTGVADRKSVV
jgi:uncharacterized radical SAM superfamily Fe-S cluster-containing enzyme